MKRPRLKTILGWSWRIIVILLTWVALAAAMNWVVMPLYVRLNHELQVPDVRGTMLHDAESVFGKKGFRIVVYDERPDPVAPEGEILAQQPPPGQSCKRGRRIHVTISAGPFRVEVPNVVGKTKEDAMFAMRKAGIHEPRLGYVFSESTFEGRVVAQDPDPGMVVPSDTSSTITISMGREPASFVVPMVVGLPEDQARYLIRKAGLRIGEVRYDKYVRQKDGVVILQTPRGEEPAEKDARIDLVVNRKYMKTSESE